MVFVGKISKDFRISASSIRKINLLFCIVGLSIIPIQFIRGTYPRLLLTLIYVGACCALAFHRYRFTSYYFDNLMVDELTGVYNYRYFILRLKEEIKRFKRYSRPLVLAFIDCDNFKEYNDRYGHIEGNKALERIGHILMNNIRACDIVARFGGDEFAVILPETDLVSARVVIGRMKEIIDSTSFAGDAGEITLSISLVSYKGESLEDFLSRADAILYEAKRDSKNIIIVHE